ncbi:MAG: PD-(D/E)XK nuclease family protein [Candidatus Falkowbacteria bacterium]|nr:PD-(D/E)XK nuclease family protein [Candidatus Falkowbacteria bacterium]
MGLEIEGADSSKLEDFDLIKDLADGVKALETIARISLPTKFSFSQFAAYAACPLQYKFAFILKIPAVTKNQFIFGQLIHHSLYQFLLPLISEAQASLFGEKSKSNLSKKQLLDIYETNFTPDNWESEADRDKYHQEGRKNLGLLFDNFLTTETPTILFLEKSFTIKINQEVVKGTIDRIDKLPDGTVEIADYKTGNPKEKLAYEDKKQLLLYQIVAEELLNLKVSALAFYYLRNGSKVTFVAKDKELEKLKLEIREIIKSIKAHNFAPTPEEHVCKFCDFNSICEFRKV